MCIMVMTTKTTKATQDNAYIKSMGQYFTTNELLREAVVDMISNSPTTILEPSVGRGDLVVSIRQRYPEIQYDMYEIDNNIVLLDGVDSNKVTYVDFLEEPIERTYDTIVGNPPFVKKPKGNLYFSFIRKCVGLLNSGGELIFIVPSDFMKLTGSVQLIDEMMLHGTFTHIVHPKDERLFENAAIDVVVFRYCKDESLGSEVVFNGEKRWLVHHGGTLSFVPEAPDVSRPRHTVADYFHVFVGMVSGKESVFKNQELGNVDVLNGNGDKEKYILIDKFPTDNPALNTYMTEHKPQLMERRIRAFGEKNWYEWGALRNYSTMQKRAGEPCIYVRTVTRNNIVAFAGTVGPIGGNLLMLIPKSYVAAEPTAKNNKGGGKSKACSRSKKKGACDTSSPDMTQERMGETVAYLNSEQFKEEFMYSGRFKIGHRQLASASWKL